MRLRRRWLSALALCAAAPVAASDLSIGYVQGPGGYYDPATRAGPYTIGLDGIPIMVGAVRSASSIATGQQTAGTTATQIVASRPGRRAVTLVGGGTTDAYCGAAGVTPGTGVLLTGAKGTSMTIPTSGAVYCVVASGSQSISYLETY